MEINSKIIWGALLSAIASLLLLDMDFFTNIYEGRSDNKSVVKSISRSFSKDYRNIYIDVELTDSMSRAMVMNNHYIDSVRVEERRLNQEELIEEIQPRIVEIEEGHNQRFDDIHTLIVVDLTLSEEQIEAQRRAVRTLYRSTFNDNLHLKFAHDGGISPLTLVTDYVLDNMFVKQRDENYLLRDIVQQYNDVRFGTSYTYGISCWADIPNKHKLLFVFSDEQTYRNGYPIDYYNYTQQQKMHSIIEQVSEDESVRVPLYYISFNTTPLPERDDIEVATSMRIKNLCRATGGDFFNSFSYSRLFETVSRLQNIRNVKYRVTLENPDFKLYAGAMMCLDVKSYVAGEEIFSELLTYSVGHFYDPIFVNFTPTLAIKIKGVLLILILMLLIYLALQIVYPYLLYRFYFCRKYITTYSDQYAVYAGNIVDQRCNYCKAKFERGDKIVTKCRHTTHLECWMENHYRCPEFGEECKEGSYYYNQENIFDPRNAPNVMMWLLSSAVAALMVWLSYFVIKGIDMPLVDQFFISTLNMIDSMELFNDTLADNISSGRHLYKYGFTICFWTTLVLGLQASWHSHTRNKIPIRIALSVLSGLGGALSFFLFAILLTPVGTYNNMLLASLVLWLVNSLFIYLASSYETRLSFKRMFLSLFITAFFAILTLVATSEYCGNKLESYYIQLFFNLIYCLGFAISFAFILPPSKRYFLRVEGATKPMDVALFKWFNSRNNRGEVYIGRSIDCDIHLDWDISEKIEPIHASIVMRNGSLVLIPKCDMEISRRAAKLGERYSLTNNMSFTIGKTTFTYIEKDFYNGR